MNANEVKDALIFILLIEECIKRMRMSTKKILCLLLLKMKFTLGSIQNQIMKSITNLMIFKSKKIFTFKSLNHFTTHFLIKSTFHNVSHLLVKMCIWVRISAWGLLLDWQSQKHWRRPPKFLFLKVQTAIYHLNLQIHLVIMNLMSWMMRF